MKTTTIQNWTGNPASCAARETSRYAINGILPVGVKDESGWLVATDGRSLSFTAANIDRPGKHPIIPHDAFKGAASIVLNGDIRSIKASKSKAVTVHEPEEGSFPPIMDVVPDPDRNQQPVTWISLNAALLLAVARAVTDGVEHVTIGITAANKPILVMPVEGPGLGVLMPVNGDGNADNKWAERRKAIAADMKAAQVN